MLIESRPNDLEDRYLVYLHNKNSLMKPKAAYEVGLSTFDGRYMGYHWVIAVVVDAAEYNLDAWYVAAANDYWHPLAYDWRPLEAHDFKQVSALEATARAHAWIEEDNSGFAAEAFIKQVEHVTSLTKDVFDLLDGDEIYVFENVVEGVEVMYAGPFYASLNQTRQEITLLFAGSD